MKIEFVKLLARYPARYPKELFPEKEREWNNKPLQHPNGIMAGIEELKDQYNGFIGLIHYYSRTITMKYIIQT